MKRGWTRSVQRLVLVPDLVVELAAGFQAEARYGRL
jgi:hypothetical protein